MLFNTSTLGTPDDRKNRHGKKNRKNAVKPVAENALGKIGVAIVIMTGVLGIPAMIAFANLASPIVLK